MIGAYVNIFAIKEATDGEIYGGTGTFDNYQMCRVDSTYKRGTFQFHDDMDSGSLRIIWVPHKLSLALLPICIPSIESKPFSSLLSSIPSQ
jgi:hypothetical protein